MGLRILPGEGALRGGGVDTWHARGRHSQPYSQDGSSDEVPVYEYCSSVLLLHEHSTKCTDGKGRGRQKNDDDDSAADAGDK